MEGVEDVRVRMGGEFNGKGGKVEKVCWDKGVFRKGEVIGDLVDLILVDSVERVEFMGVG